MTRAPRKICVEQFSGDSPGVAACAFFSDGRRENCVPFVVSSFACEFATEISAVLLCKDGVFP